MQETNKTDLVVVDENAKINQQTVTVPDATGKVAIELTPHQIGLLEAWSKTHPGLRAPLYQAAPGSNKAIWLNRAQRRERARFTRLAAKHTNTDPSVTPPTALEILEAKVAGGEKLSQRERRLLNSKIQMQDGLVTTVGQKFEFDRMTRAFQTNLDFIANQERKAQARTARRSATVAKSDTQPTE